jgi:hypothetical protein
MKNVYNFIASKENSSGQLFTKWSLSQLATYMSEYAALNKVASSSDIIGRSFPTDKQVETQSEAYAEKCNDCYTNDFYGFQQGARWAIHTIKSQSD